MKSAGDFYVFEKWKDAPSYAFGEKGAEGIVPNDDKEAYWRIYEELRLAFTVEKDASPDGKHLSLRPKNYSRERGSRGHRPVDLWFAICPEGAEVFGHMPQVYAIASGRGLEVGFAASIPEADYFDVKAKERNRTIVPFINSKLPSGSEELTQKLDLALQANGGWHFNEGTRFGQGDPGFDNYQSLAQMLDHLKSEGAATGGGTVCRVFPVSQLGGIDLDAEVRNALLLFAPLLSRCAPSKWDTEIRLSQAAVEALDVPVAPPATAEEGRRRVLAEVARRQGQASFRRKLLEAYNGRCAITGTGVADVLQAAHIRPYNGQATNHVTNGLLLRADLHTLFDLKLITINPVSLKIVVSKSLRGTMYWQYDGKKLALPDKPAMHPSSQALEDHHKLAKEGDGHH